MIIILNFAGFLLSGPPVIELPPSGPGAAEVGTGAHSSTIVGGYAEMHYTNTVGDGAMVDFHRFVLYVGHDFGGPSFHTELELEHALAGPGKPGEVLLEQAYFALPFTALSFDIEARAGIVLVPFGLTNIHHEPNTFLSVERPAVDKLIIPTTWSEAGAGVLINLHEEVGLQVFLLSGLRADGFSLASGIRDGRQKIAEAAANNLAGLVRVEYTPRLNIALGLSGYFGASGGNSKTATLRELSVPVRGAEIDLRASFAGVLVRAQAVAFSIGQTGRLNKRSVSDDAEVPPVQVAKLLWGGYIEAGYDIWRHLATEDDRLSILPFVRGEVYDTAARLAFPGSSRQTIDLSVGLSVRPIPQIAIKADFNSKTQVGGKTTKTVNLGVGGVF